jgi:hypothetical protein
LAQAGRAAYGFEIDPPSSSQTATRQHDTARATRALIAPFAVSLSLGLLERGGPSGKA